MVRSGKFLFALISTALMVNSPPYFPGFGVALAYPIALECVSKDSAFTSKIIVDKKWFQNPTLVWRRGASSESYVVAEIDELFIRAAGRGVSGYSLGEPVIDEKLIEVDRLSGHMKERILFNPLFTPILSSRCDNEISFQQCTHQVEAIEEDEKYLCDIYEEQPYRDFYCDLWRSNENVAYEIEWKCSKAEARF